MSDLGNDEKHVGIFRLISKERSRQEQIKREGRFRYTAADAGMGNAERLACLVEEVGEVAQEVLTHEGRRLARDTVGTVEGLRKELIQVAAIVVAWLESDCNPMAIYEGMPAEEEPEDPRERRADEEADAAERRLDAEKAGDL